MVKQNLKFLTETLSLILLPDSIKGFLQSCEIFIEDKGTFIPVKCIPDIGFFHSHRFIALIWDIIIFKNIVPLRPSITLDVKALN